MTLLQYVEANPWWTLIYLLVIASAFNGLITITFRRRE